jgi:microcin C transport system substrate-binding protein
VSGAINRRSVLVLATSAIAAAMLPRFAFAQQGEERHGMSAFGDLKYPPDFHHFEYVNPNAPKGGRFSHVGSSRMFNQNFLTFNSLNSYVLSGDAAMGMQMTFASLMARALDEPDASYGLTARAVRIDDGGATYRFFMRPETRFHDGSPLTAEDAAWSLNTLKEKGHPIIRQLLRDMERAEAEDAATLAVRFKPERGREAPLFVAGLPIFSRAYYANRNFEESTLDIPLGSGPYKVGRFEAGRYIEFDRVPDWWGADLPVSRGTSNFDVIRFEYFRDRDVAFEAFTAGQYLFREEFTSRIWATRYDFPAIKEGRVKREVLKDETPSGAQGWFLNTRRQKFRDPRVREALVYAFDFEWTNQNLMYGSYDRTHSYFQNSEMMAEGPPSPEELALLEPHRAQLPKEVFGEPFVPPVSDGSGQDRRLLRRAVQLLEEAGWTVRNEVDPANPPSLFDRVLMTVGLKAPLTRRVLRGPKGELFEIEFLLQEPSFQPHHMPYIRNLERIGIAGNVRLVDSAQYQARLNDFDFDIAIQRFGFSSTPGESLRNYFGSDAAAIKGSQNLSGIADPVIDALIERIVKAETREALTFACRALDRVLRAGRYWVPHWYKGTHWIAYWDRFARPPEKPRYARGIPDTWWAKPGQT